MASAGGGDAEFESWLSAKLKFYNTDDSVLIPYVKGILEGEEEDEAEKHEALVGILAEISSDNVEELCQEIIKKWSAVRGCADAPTHSVSGAEAASTSSDPHLEDRIAQIMLQQAENSVKLRPVAANHNAEVKQAILAQYSEVADVATDDEEGGQEEEGAEGAAAAQAAKGGPQAQSQHLDKSKEKSGAANLLVRNTNAETVAKAEREKREVAKAEAEKKRQQDKLNKEKQKEAAAERKDKEKKRTQKGERRR